tara:strand:+ start:664 stop:1590 length:927 start_codon:yes stop_codon:yes gene_type:complete
MSENETMQPDVPTPEVNTPQSSGETPVVDINSTVRVGDTEVPISELVSGYQKVAGLEKYKENASRLVRGGAMSPDERIASMKYILETEGYTPAQIEAQVRASQEVYDEAYDDEGYEEPMPEPNEAPAPPPNIDQEARAEIDRVRHQNNQMMVENLKRDLNESMTKTMGSNANIRTLLDKSKQLAGEEGFDERAANIRSEVQRIAMEGMRTRRNRGESFDKSWFDQETTKAADAVYQRIRSVIGDPDKIQRAPETASDLEQFISKPPVAAPTFEKGDNMGSATDKARDFTVDTLSRIANDLSAGGESRI